jgi:hypothetical protein
MVVPFNPFLHDPMTAALRDGKESMVFENSADFRAPKELGAYPTGT